ncbi:hypothetical protein F4679DRAFT_544287 [Xylaria curta]|nr:hypothetical protein F4679DRAFT_544287 [Xylaria curta]
MFSGNRRRGNYSICFFLMKDAAFVTAVLPRFLGLLVLGNPSDPFRTNLFMAGRVPDLVTNVTLNVFSPFCVGTSYLLTIGYHG